YTREYHFSVPCAAFLTASLYALVRSDRLRSTGWALAWGALMGLAVLSRTMAAGFVPGIFVAGAVLGIAGSQSRWGVLANLVGAAGAMVLVAAIWYARNLHPVLDYLRGFGYGSHSAEFGRGGSLTSVHRWTDDI